MRSHAKASPAGSIRRRTTGLTFLLALVVLLPAALAPCAASAGTIIAPAPFSPITGSGTGVTIHFPSGVAVDEASGNVFLNDGGFAEEVVDVFGSAGGVPSGVAFPYQVSGGFFFATEPSGVAVDNSATSPAKGTLYVADVVNSEVKKFTLNPLSEKYEAAGVLAPTIGEPFAEPLGVAVDSHGSVFVADYGSQSIVEFDSSGTQIARIGTSKSVIYPSSLALDSADDLFVQGLLNGRVYKYPANKLGEVEEEKFTQVVGEGASGVAVDTATNSLYIALGDHVARRNAANLEFQEEFGEGALTSTERLGVNSKTGRVYVADAGAEDLAAFEPVAVPDVLSGEASAVSTEAATLNGTVNPAGLPLSECSFEYGAESSYGKSVPCAESLAVIGEGSSPVKVHADVSGLAIGATYHFRLKAKNANGTVNGGDQSFRSAGPPEVHGESVHPHDTTARLIAQIYPGRQTTEYQFEYTDKASFEAHGFAGATAIPIPPGSIKAGAQDVEVAQSIGGLIPSSAYRFRVVATNPSGSVAGADQGFTTYASQGGLEPCAANEALRVNLPSANLPDCRAYEQATPIAKNGGNPAGHIFSLKASVNGDAVNFESAIGIPGGEGAQEFPTYLASRGAGGWSTQGLLPPGSVGQDAQVLGWTPDFAQVFDQVYEPGLGAALLSRSSADRSLTAIVPYTSPAPRYSFAGASADGSTVLFSASVPSGGLTPNAATDKANLYAWDRESGQISLAGILPDGSTPANGSIAGGTGLEYIQDEHAIAADGSVYFSEPKGGQLYLRENPTAPETTQKDAKGNCVPDPLLACTVHVSASQRTVADPGGTLPVTFQGASADGSTAFFTSSEELTDNAHTTPSQAIGRANLSDGSDNEGSFIPANAAAIAVDGSHIYWADTANDSIGRAKLNGEEPKPNFITGTDNPKGVAVDGSHIYWTNAADGSAGAGSIGRADLNGENINQSCVSGASDPRGIDLDSNYIYWANAGAGSGAIGRADLGCTNPNQTFITEKANNAVDVAVDTADTYLYIARDNGGGGSNIAFVNRDGSPGGEFLPGLLGATHVVVDASHLYWVDPYTNSIARSDLDGKNANQSFIGALKPQGIAVDGSHVYWGNHPTATSRGADLYRYKAESGELTDVAPDPAGFLGADMRGVLGASSDASYVYFAANGVPTGVTNSPNAGGESAAPGSCQGASLSQEAGTCNLYLAHAGTVTFIARLEADQHSDGDVTNWLPERGVLLASEAQRTSRISTDGRTLLFRSKRQLTAYDNEGEVEFYRYRVGDPGVICVTCNPTGAPPAGPARLGSIVPPLDGAVAPASMLSRNLSADGNRVFFETRDALVAADTNGDEGCAPWGDYIQLGILRTCQDAYEWEANGTGSCHSEAQDGGCLYLLSSGKSTDASFFIDASASGDDAFVMTSSQLARQDKDELLDIYDTKVGGGLASQNAISPVPCEGEACKAGASSPPQSESAGSERFTAPGNPKPRHKAAKAKHRHRTKKRHHAKRHKRHVRGAKTNGRAS
jgi:virginiamycin B lyase